LIDVLCIGHVAYDINIPVPFYPTENSKLEVNEIIEESGGPAANGAFLLAKWGVRAAFSGLVGNDLFGQKIIQEFKQAAIDITLTAVSPDYPTPLSVVQVNCQNGSRTIVNRKVSKAILDLKPENLLKMNPKILLLDGHELQASLTAIKKFPKALTVLDAGSLRKGTEILAGIVDYLVCSERFALAATGLPHLKNEIDWQECLRLLKKINNHGQVVVTLGERGLIYDDHGCLVYLPAYNAETVDTTGAGDIFHGAFVYGILNHLLYEDVLKLAAMAASLSVTRRGGQHSIPVLTQVKGAISTNPSMYKIRTSTKH
jgi:sugar/nucleoside kinase (ribokinase family)